MSERNDFILARSQASRSAQASLKAKWLWEEKSVAGWDADISAFLAKREAVADAEAGRDADVGQLDANLNSLHQLTQTSLSLFKNKHRKDSAKIHLLKPLSAVGDSRNKIMEEALEWESAWEKLDPAWAPLPDQSLTAFKALRLKCEALTKTYADSKANWRNEVGGLNELANAMHESCVAWYDAATSLFRSGTAEGDMIRATVPTTSNTTEIPEKATITLVEGQAGGRVALEFTAEHGTSFDVFHRAPGQTSFVKIGDGVPEPAFEHGPVMAGVHGYKVSGKNSRGTGPESDVASVTIA